MLPFVTMVVALVLSACGSGSTKDSAKARPLTSPQLQFLIANGQGPDVPALGEAQEILLRNCMKRHGLRYYTAPLQTTPESSAGDIATGEGQNEAAELAKRRESGYGIFDRLVKSQNTGDAEESIKQTRPNDYYVMHLSQSAQSHYMRVFSGGASDGCIGAAERQLYGSVSSAREVTSNVSVRQSVINSTQADPRVIAASNRWRTCFQKAAGKRFQSSNAVQDWLVAQYQHKGTTRAMRDLEIRFAVADTRCAFSSRLASVYTTVFDHYADHLTAQQEGLLLSLYGVEKRALGRAKRILNTSAL